MTVSVEDCRFYVVGDGSNKTFAVNFPVLQKEDFLLRKYHIATGVFTTILASEFDVVFNEDWTSTITYPSSGSALSSAYRLYIERNMEYLQPVEIRNQRKFLPRAVEDGLDRAILQVQQLKLFADDVAANYAVLAARLEDSEEDITNLFNTIATRVLKLADADTTVDLNDLPLQAARAGKLLGFDLSGEPTAVPYNVVSDVVALIPSDGVTDASDHINILLAAGRVIDLRPETEATYLIKKPLIYATDSSGLICSRGKAKLKVDLGAGAFDNTSYANRFSITTGGSNKYAVVVYASGRLRPILRNIRIVPTAWTEYRYILPVCFRGCTDIRVQGNEITNFSRGICMWFDDIAYGDVSENYIHDCYTKSATMADGTTPVDSATAQLAGMVFDGDCTFGSKFVRVHHNHIQDLTQSAAILALIGNQVDGIGMAGQGVKPTRKFIVDNNTFVNLGEGIDCFGHDNLIIGNLFERMFGAGVKQIHDASRNMIIGNRFIEIAYAAILGGPADTANANTGVVIRDNYITRVNSALAEDGVSPMTWYESDGTIYYQGDGTTTWWKDVFNGGAGTVTAGIRIDVSGDANKQASKWHIRNNVMDLGNARMGIYVEGGAGPNNIFVSGNYITGYYDQEYAASADVLEFDPPRLAGRIRNSATRTFANNTSLQYLFDSAGIYRHRIYSGRRYIYKARFTVTGLSASSNAIGFAIEMLEGATIGNVIGTGTAHKGAGNNQAYHTNWSTESVQQVTNADTQTSATVEVEFAFLCTASGKIAPQVQMISNSAAASIAAGQAISELYEERNTKANYGDVI